MDCGGVDGSHVVPGYILWPMGVSALVCGLVWTGMVLLYPTEQSRPQMGL